MSGQQAYRLESQQLYSEEQGPEAGGEEGSERVLAMRHETRREDGCGFHAEKEENRQCFV